MSPPLILTSSEFMAPDEIKMVADLMTVINRSSESIHFEALKSFLALCAEQFKDENIPKTYTDDRPHLKAVKNWQQENKEKVKASYAARYYAERVDILYECRCKTDYKENHHYDYDRPYQVIRLCPKCHKEWHNKLRNLNKNKT